MRGLAWLRLLIPALALAVAAPGLAEDGYDLWLRYRPVEAPALARYRERARAILLQRASPTLTIAAEELRRGLGGLLAQPVPIVADIVPEGAILLGTPASSPLIRSLNLPLQA